MKTNLNIQTTAREIIRKIFLLTAVSGITLITSCSKEEGITPSSSSNITTSSDASQARQPSGSVGVEPNENQPPQSSFQFIGHHYRLVIAFNSTGSGIDWEAQAKLNEFINQYQKWIGKQILYQTVQVGREGELEMRFKLREIDAEEQTQFVSQVKRILNADQHPTVKVYENVLRVPGLPS